ncbi:MAG: acetylxylan esterase [Bacteriovoracaceae bacterium]
MNKVFILFILVSTRTYSEILKLPDPLISLHQEKIKTKEEWTKFRRPELLELFRSQMYGHSPIFKPNQLSYKVKKENHQAIKGTATFKEVEILIEGPRAKVLMNLLLFIPHKKNKSAPVFLLICNRNKNNIDPSRKIKREFWPVEEIIKRGYAAATFHYEDLAPDNILTFKTKVINAFTSKYENDSWAAISAWAFGASRALDYFEKDKDLDAKRVALVGHSRGGKAALWAGAQDERFAMVISNDSGAGGAALSRGKSKGRETIGFLYLKQAHWFANNFKQYGDKEEILPFDQHELISLMAPRSVYIASSSLDLWAAPNFEYQAAVEANSVYALFDKKSIVGDFPSPGVKLHEGQVAYHLRAGKHDLKLWDWNAFMDFADKQWGR